MAKQKKNQRTADQVVGPVVLDWWDAEAFSKQMVSHAVQQRCQQVRQQSCWLTRLLTRGRQHLAARLHGRRWRRQAVAVAAGQCPQLATVSLPPELLRVLEAAMGGDGRLRELADTLGMSTEETLSALDAAEAAVLGALA